MISIESWQAFGGIAAIIVLLGTLVLSLRRLGIVGTSSSVISRLDKNEACITALEKDFSQLRVHIAENYINRDDWVPSFSRMMSMLEAQGQQLARLEERINSVKKSNES